MLKKSQASFLEFFLTEGTFQSLYLEVRGAVKPAVLWAVRPAGEKPLSTKQKVTTLKRFDYL